MLQTVSDVFLSSVLQSSYSLLLLALSLHDYGFSFGDVPASDPCGVDDDKGDDNSESGLGAQRLTVEIFIGNALCCVR